MNQKHSKEYKSIGQTIKNTVSSEDLRRNNWRIWFVSALVTLPKSKHLIVTSLFTGSDFGYIGSAGYFRSSVIGRC